MSLTVNKPVLFLTFKHVTFSCLSNQAENEMLSQRSPSHWLSAAGEGTLLPCGPHMTDVRRGCRVYSQCCPHSRTSSVHLHTHSLLPAEGELCLWEWVALKSPPILLKKMTEPSLSSLSNNQHPLSHAGDEVLPLAPYLLIVMVTDGDELILVFLSPLASGSNFCARVVFRSFICFRCKSHSLHVTLC